MLFANQNKPSCAGTAHASLLTFAAGLAQVPSLSTVPYHSPLLKSKGNGAERPKSFLAYGCYKKNPEIFLLTWPQTACALRDLRAPVETWNPVGLMFEMFPLILRAEGAETCIIKLNKVTVFQILNQVIMWALSLGKDNLQCISPIHMLKARWFRVCKETSYIRKNVLLDGKCFRDY